MNMLATDEEQDPSRTAAAWLWALLPIGISVFSLSALIYYQCYHPEGVHGALAGLFIGLYQFFGFAPLCMFFLLLGVWSSIWFVSGKIDRPWMRLGRLAMMAVLLGVCINFGGDGAVQAPGRGELGGWLAVRVAASIPYYLGLVLVFLATFASLMLATDFGFSDVFERLRKGAPAVAEAGVEAEVTDHLKGLGVLPTAGVAAVVPAPVTPAPQAEPVPMSRVILDDTDVEVEPAVEEVIEPAVYRPRRRSYFERRYEASGDDESEPVSAPAAADGWLPVTPEEQDIENPETLLEQGAEESAENDTAAPVAENAPVAAEPSEAETQDAVASDAVASDAVASDEEAEDEAEVEEEVVAPWADEPAESVAAGGEEAVLEHAPEPEGEHEAISAEADDADMEALAEVLEEDADDADDDAEAGEAEEAIELEAEQVASEPVVSIPRPDPALPAPEVDLPREVRQQSLFRPAIDDALVAEAVETVTSWRRASATFLQRRLRIDYELACQLMVELSSRGVIELDEDASHGRVVGG